MIEDEDTSAPAATDAASSNSSRSSYTRQERYQIFYSKLSKQTAMSAFHLRSHRPSSRDVHELIATTDVESLDTTLEQLALLRMKTPIVLKGQTTERLVSKCISLQVPRRMLDILENRMVYGMDLSMKEAELLARQFNRSLESQRVGPVSDEMKLTAFDDSVRLIKLARYYLPSTPLSPACLIFTLSTMNRAGKGTDPRALALAKELRAMGVESVLEGLSAGGNRKNLIRAQNTAEALATTYQQEQGNKELEEFFRLLASVFSVAASPEI